MSSGINPWTIIEGKYPSYNELKDFSENRWMSLLNFMCFFIVSYENSEKWEVNSKSIDAMEAFLKIDNHPNHEWIWRIGQWKGKTTAKKYGFKLNGMAMHCLTWIKKNPGVVTEKMKELILSHPQKMAWCLEQFKVKKTLGGGEIVARDVTVKDDYVTKQTTLPSLQVKTMTAITKVADIVESLAESISSTELKKLSLDDKLKHIARLIPVITNAGKQKMVGNHLTQINLNGSTEDMEKAMLNFTKKISE